MRFALIAALLMGGCSVDQASFPQQSANIMCPKYKECQAGYFESVFGDMSTCKSDMTEFSENLIYVMENGLACTYDPVEAGKCLRALSAMSCEDLYNSTGFEGECSNAFTGCIEQ